MSNEIVFLGGAGEAAAASARAVLGECIVVSDLATLERTPGRTLVCLGSGVIVPARVLGSFKQAYNIHAASPDFPGRDPHHWAVYAGASEYGATIHVMTERVDSGAIVGVEAFPVPVGAAAPADLLALANAASYRLLEWAAQRLQEGSPLEPIAETWRGPKRSRRDLLALCRIGPEIDAAEATRRRRAFAGFPITYG